MATTYIKHKHRNTDPSVFIHPQNVEKQYRENLPLDFRLKYGFTFPD